MAIRKISILFAFAVILGVAYGDVAADDNESEWPAGISPLASLSFWSEEQDRESAAGDGDAKGCCLPKTWTGKLFSEVKRGERTVRLRQAVYVDQTNKRVAVDTVIPRRRNVSSILIFGKSDATLYTFSKAAKKCAKRVLKGAEFRPQCLSPNATLRGSFSLGAGAGALKTQSWGYVYHDRRVAIDADLILTPGNCVPVLAGERIVTRPRVSDENDPEKKKKPQVTSIGTLYTDVTPRIADPSVFTPPSYCTKTEDNNLTFEPDVDVITVIERYVAVP